MRRTATAILVLLALMTSAPMARAGDTSPPPGPVSSTMRSLAEIEPRTPITSLPLDITQPGSYYLTGDLTTASYGIRVIASDVTIDLMGFTITGPGSPNNHGIFVWSFDQENVTIRNGTVRSFEDGVASNGWDNDAGNGVTVENVNALDITRYGIDLRGRNNRIHACFAEASDTANPGSFGITIIRGTMTQCRASGFAYGLAGLEGAVIKDSMASGCDYGIIISDSLVNGCAVQGSITQSILELGTTNSIVNTLAP